ncbi:MAG: hypothetical protein HYV09_33870 [Deltaproteobacteria bacterium]|nr:hypothetical protein [Deltaproteobacteria bacterium]
MIFSSRGSSRGPTRAATLSATALAAIGAIGSLVAVGACRRAADERPVAALSSSSELDARFDRIRARWIEADTAGRAALRADLAALVIELDKRGDGLEPLARAFLALSWLDSGVPAAAEAVSRPLVDGPPGVANDLGTLVKGAAARRLGRAREAIDLLRPLIGKLLDPFARPLLYEEITEAFLDDGNYEEALAYAEGWLRSATGAEKKEVRAAVARVLRRVPEAVLIRVLETDALAPPEARRSPEMRVILAAAVDKSGGGTAEEPSAAPTDGGTTAAKADAAPTPAPMPIPTTFLPVRFDPKTIALIVPTSANGYGASASAVVRAAAAVASPSLATSLHGDAGVGLGAPVALDHRLAVLDSAGTTLGTTRALDAAEREGAGVVIGGLTEAESSTLASLAQQRRIPTILLRRPSAPPALAAGEKQVWITLGPSSDEEAKATIATAQAAIADAAIVEPWPFPGDTAPPPTDPMRARCDAQPKLAGASTFPVAAWRAKKVSAVVVLGDARCARRVADEIVATTPPWRPTLIVAPSALELAHVTLPLPRTIVGVGLLPADDAAPGPLRALWKDQGGPVGLWNALGHDAAALAAAALPGDLTPATDTAAMQKARATTLARLRAAKTDLWTSTAKGPDGSGAVAQQTRVRTVPAGSSVTPAWSSP